MWVGFRLDLDAMQRSAAQAQILNVNGIALAMTPHPPLAKETRYESKLVAFAFPVVPSNETWVSVTNEASRIDLAFAIAGGHRPEPVSRWRLPKNHEIDS